MTMMAMKASSASVASRAVVLACYPAVGAATSCCVRAIVGATTSTDSRDFDGNQHNYDRRRYVSDQEDVRSTGAGGIFRAKTVLNETSRAMSTSAIASPPEADYRCTTHTNFASWQTPTSLQNPARSLLKYSLLRNKQQQRIHQMHYEQRCNVSTLILLRHGQSQWNGPNSRFTGWSDVPLTVKGRVEAVAAGQLLKSRGFMAKRVCVAFTSELQRAHETCELALASMAGHEQHTWSSQRIRRDFRLNERHYGNVQGLHKDDPNLIDEYGIDTIRHWRRSLHGKPPPMEPSHEHYQPPPAPATESLYDCQQRVLGCWYDNIAPSLFEEEGLPFSPDKRTIIVAAHANTIRSLIAYFDKVPEERVTKIHVPNSVPILYRFDTATRQPMSIKLDSSHGGSHARWMLSSENHMAIRQAISRGGLLTRALFDAMGAGPDLTITGADLEQGVKQLIKDSPNLDCVVIGVAKRIARKLQPDDVIHIKEFEQMCREGTEAIQLKHLNPSDMIAPTEDEYGVA